MNPFLLLVVEMLVGALVSIAWARAWAITHRAAPRLHRSRMVARLTVIYMDRDDNWRGDYAYFEAADFTRCRAKAAEWLRAFARGDAVADLYRTWPSSMHPRELTGAELADEFRNPRGESITYAFQPMEWVS